MALGLFLLWRSMRAGGARRSAIVGMWLVGVGVVVLYAACTPFVATMLARGLERQTPYLAVADAPRVDAIVVLGGGESVYVAQDGQVDIYERIGDRFERGIAAFRANKAPLFAVGGGASPLPSEPLISDWLRAQAVARGVPASAIITGGKALYTEDESEDLAKQLRERAVQRVLLCTSAYHMPRAKLLYERQGFTVTALPCDFRSRGEAETFSFKLFLPRGVALDVTETCLKEWLGLAAYRLLGRGWST